MLVDGGDGADELKVPAVPTMARAPTGSPAAPPPRKGKGGVGAPQRRLSTVDSLAAYSPKGGGGGGGDGGGDNDPDVAHPLRHGIYSIESMRFPQLFLDAHQVKGSRGDVRLQFEEDVSKMSIGGEPPPPRPPNASCCCTTSCSVSAHSSMLPHGSTCHRLGV